MSLYVDSGILFGAAVASDAKHRAAVQLLRKALHEAPLTSDHVVVEVWMMLRRRRGWDKAMLFLESLRETSLCIETVSTADLERARGILRNWQNLELDLVDATSIAIMERVGCRRVATFDSDFAVYRFGRDKRAAFEIWT